MQNAYKERLYYVALTVKDSDRIVRKRLSPDYFDAGNARRACEQLRQKHPQACVVEQVRFL